MKKNLDGLRQRLIIDFLSTSKINIKIIDEIKRLNKFSYFIGFIFVLAQMTILQDPVQLKKVKAFLIFEQHYRIFLYPKRGNLIGYPQVA